MDVSRWIARSRTKIVGTQVLCVTESGFKFIGECLEEAIEALEIARKMSNDFADHLLTGGSSPDSGEGLGCHNEMEQDPDLEARPGDNRFELAGLTRSTLSDLIQRTVESWMAVSVKNTECLIVIFGIQTFQSLGDQTRRIGLPSG